MVFGETLDLLEPRTAPVRIHGGGLGDQGLEQPERATMLSYKAGPVATATSTWSAWAAKS